MSSAVRWILVGGPGQGRPAAIEPHAPIASVTHSLDAGNVARGIGTERLAADESRAGTAVPRIAGLARRELTPRVRKVYGRQCAARTRR